jgi:DNA-binding protein H-NS
MSIDLTTLSLKELKALQADVAKAISGFAERQKREAMAELEVKAKELGFTLAELLGKTAKKTRAATTAKYAHPENPSLTWSGRGRQPQWFKDAIAAGKSADDLEI